MSATASHQACDLRAVSCIFVGISALINYGLISQSNSYDALAERDEEESGIERLRGLLHWPD